MAKENKTGLSDAVEKEFVLRVRKALFDDDNSCYLKTVDKIMDETGETAAEIAAALIGMAFKGSAQKNSSSSRKKTITSEKVNKPHVNALSKANAKAKPAASAKDSSKTVSLSINGGLNKHFTHKDILGAFSAKVGLKGSDISDVQIGSNKTSLKVSSHNAAKIISAMNAEDGKIKGVPVKVQVIKEKKTTKRKPNKKNHLGKL